MVCARSVMNMTRIEGDKEDENISMSVRCREDRQRSKQTPSHHIFNAPSTQPPNPQPPNTTMAPLTFHLLSVPDTTQQASLLTSLRALPPSSRPFYVGQTHHWIHEPTLSVPALLGTTPSPKPWTHLLVCPSSGADDLALPAGLDISGLQDKWSIAAPVDDSTWLTNYHSRHTERQTATPPSLPAGWSPTESSALLAAEPPTDLSASLALASRPLGKPEPLGLQSFTAAFGTTHPGPVSMFNLLSYTPSGGKAKYYNYIAAFSASIGVKYGGQPLFLGQEVTGWSSRATEEEGEGGEGWDDCALVWYPSLWHFAKMLDDAEYERVDREFKTGSLRDNPLICCTEIEVAYED